MNDNIKNKIIKLFNDTIKELNIKTNNNYISRNYSEDKYFEAYLFFLNNSFYFNRYVYYETDNNNNVICEINGKYLNQKVNYWNKMNIIESMYNKIIKLYIKNTNKNNFKYLSVDSQFVLNKQMNKKFIGRNIQYKSKNGLRISAIVDIKGIPLINSINSGNKHDATFLIEMMQKIINLGLDPLTFKNKKNSPMYLLGDAGYDSNNNINYIQNNYMYPIIDYNKRNTKNIELIEKRKFTKKEEKIFKNRHIVENYHAWKETKIPKLGKIYVKNIKNYIGENYMANINLIISRNCVKI